MVYGLKEKSYQERLNDLDMYSLEKRRDREDMIETFKYVKGIHKVEEGSIFKRKQNSKTRGHSLRLEGQRFNHFNAEDALSASSALPLVCRGRAERVHPLGSAFGRVPADRWPLWCGLTSSMSAAHPEPQPLELGVITAAR
uniref:Uncharacterized protein n=1 Tax=Leptobrachium leishanense TaxID=445787 RepID=A0A8C5LPK3_9ANUR